MVAFSPHILQLGFLRSLNSRNFICQASNSSSRLTSVSGAPRINLIVSVAWIVPTIPGKTPSTPPSAQLGTSPGGGGSAYKQRSYGTPQLVASVLYTLVSSSNPQIAHQRA